MGYSWPKRRLLPRRNKYNAVRVGPYGSMLEKAVYDQLRLRERAGLIMNIRQQTYVELVCGIGWKVDFSFLNTKTGETEYAEAKGVETERYRILVKLWAGGFGPGRLEVWKGDYRKPRLANVINPERRRP